MPNPPRIKPSALSEMFGAAGTINEYNTVAGTVFWLCYEMLGMIRSIFCLSPFDGNQINKKTIKSGITPPVTGLKCPVIAVAMPEKIAKTTNNTNRRSQKGIYGPV